MKEIKAWAVVAFYIAATVGCIDMAAQATSHGCVRPISSALEFIFRMPSATPLPAHCVVPVEIVIKGEK